jgi:transcriptional regulator with PAS, ATPase and Fis domain
MRDTPKRAAPPTRPPEPGTWGLLVCDGDRVRTDALSLLARRHRPGLKVLGCAPADRWPETGKFHLALVTIEVGSIFTDDALAFIRECRRRGLTVIAHALDLDGWSVAQKCRPLIAGAASVLNGSARDFPAVLSAALDATLKTLGSCLDEERHVCARLRALGVEGESAAMVDIFRHTLRFGALSDLPVLLTGETGTGKERLTQALHQCDVKRCRGPFVAVNCAALSPTLAESELFGHRRGAFTGADRDRLGLVRAADRGVLFLDEIGELDLTLQAKLLRVLQEGRVLPVGEEQEVSVDVRVFAATNRQLPDLVAAGRFRADLYHRLRVLELKLPPLRGRPADIVRLTLFFLRKYQALHPAAHQQPNRDFLEALTRLALPGNVRQLENLVRQTLVNKRDDSPLALADLSPELLQELAEVDQRPPAEPAAPTAPAAAGLAALGAATADSLLKIVEENEWNLGRSVRACEREMLVAALRRFKGNQTKAASLLGVTARSVYNKVRKFGLQF